MILVMNMKIRTLTATLALSAFSSSVSADILVEFTESAPKDSFSFTNEGDCKRGAGNLIFDTTAAGKGVEVFQPFENVDGVALVSSAEVNDGDQSVTVKITDLEPGGIASFTIDVDDSLENSELGNIRVTGSEMQGTSVTFTLDNETTHTSLIDANNKARAPVDACS